ncbi:MAG: DUF370 domain-containing protein [Thermodesulfovibrionales bacterium]|jgi:hypothetical protein|nr:DUF370 domain-containing protein [Thermodesulfovibrionales bacterium]
MKNFLVNIGFGNVVSAGRVVAVVNPGSSPIKKLREEARERGKLIDATEGKKIRSIIITDSDHIILSAIQVETIVQRISGQKTSAEGI